MKQIERIYSNDFGIAFYWTKDNTAVKEKVQLVFRETGFYFTVRELSDFALMIKDSAARNDCCADCGRRNQCARFLLKTPCDQIDLAVSAKELDAIKDLVEGTLFRIKTAEYYFGIGRN
jgi:hypothetical protein